MAPASACAGSLTGRSRDLRLVVPTQRDPAAALTGRLLAFLVTVLSVTVAIAPVHAQPARPVEVRAELSAGRVYVGEPARLTITIQNADHADTPTVPSTPDYAVEYVGEANTSQTSLLIINGRREDRSTLSYSIQYNLTPRRAGRFTIPAITVTIDGKEFITDSIEAEAFEPEEATGSTLVLALEKPSAYVGEALKLTLTWYLRSDERSASIALPESDSYDLRVPAAWEPAAARAASPNQRLAEVHVNGQKVIGVIGVAELNGEQRTTFSLERLLIPRQSGTLAIGPARAVFNIPVGRRRPTWTDSPFDDLNTYERRQATSQTLRLDVRPLPSPAPPGFTGLVGAFTLDAAATPTVLNVGDPFTLSLRVGGPEPLDLVPPLDLTKQRGFAGAFKLPPEPVLPSVLPTAAIFTLDLRPTSDRVKELPAIELPYFDTARGEYAVARTKPIPLMVKPTREVTLDDLPPEGGSTGTAAAEPKALGWSLPSANGLSFANSPTLSLTQRLLSPTGAAIAAGSLGMYAAAWIIGLRRRHHARDPGGRRRLHAKRRALRRLRAAERDPAPTLAAAGALRGFVADAIDAPDAGVTSGDALRYFEASHPHLALRARSILVACDRASFADAADSSGAEPVPSDLISQARALIKSSDLRPRAASPERGEDTNPEATR